VAGSVEAQGAAPADEAAAADAAVDGAGTLRAVIQPWGIQVRARLAGTPAHRVWHAMSDSLFNAFDAVERDMPPRVHHGLIERLVRVEDIAEIVDGSLALPHTGCVPVRFNAVAWLSDEAGASWVSEGGLRSEGRAAIACHGVGGWLVIEPDIDWVAALERRPAQGHVAALIDVGSTGFWLRATHIEATSVTAPDGSNHLVLALGGAPVLPSAGRWLVTRRHPHEREPQALPAGQAMPVIRPHGDLMWHVADAVDLFALLRHAGTSPPRVEYGFVHDGGTQKLYFPHPRIEWIAVRSSGECGRLRLAPGARLQFADWRALLLSRGAFPAADAVVNVRLSEAEMPTLGLDGWCFHLRREWRDKRPATILEAGDAKLLLRHGNAAHPETASLDIRFSELDWSASLGPQAIELHADGQRLMSLAFDGLHAACDAPTELFGPHVIPGGVLQRLDAWLPGLWTLPSLDNAASGLPERLPLTLQSGRLHIGSPVSLPTVALGMGSVEHASLALGGTVNAQPPELSFGLELGNPLAPATLRASPDTGTVAVRIGVANGGAQIDVHLALRLPMGFERQGLDSGSAAMSADLMAFWGDPVRLGGTVSGQATLELLDGLATTSVAIAAACRVRPDRPTRSQVRIEADVVAGLHLPLCSLLDIEGDTRWPFAADIARGPGASEPHG
jgi:hypothetical protein